MDKVPEFLYQYFDSEKATTNLSAKIHTILMVTYEGCNRPVGVGEGFASKLEQRHQLGKDALKMVFSWRVKVLASKDKSSSR